MTETSEMTMKKPNSDKPILQLNRINYVKVGGKILDATGTKLDEYIRYASQRLNTPITSGDVIEHGLKLLFDRDSGFKMWLKNE